MGSLSAKNAIEKFSCLGTFKSFIVFAQIVWILSGFYTPSSILILLKQMVESFFIIGKLMVTKSFSDANFPSITE